jgi:hypothetical protein
VKTCPQLEHARQRKVGGNSLDQSGCSRHETSPNAAGSAASHSGQAVYGIRISRVAAVLTRAGFDR